MAWLPVAQDAAKKLGIVEEFHEHLQVAKKQALDTPWGRRAKNIWDKLDAVKTAKDVVHHVLHHPTLGKRRERFGDVAERIKALEQRVHNVREEPTVPADPLAAAMMHQDIGDGPTVPMDTNVSSEPSPLTNQSHSRGQPFARYGRSFKRRRYGRRRRRSRRGRKVSQYMRIKVGYVVPITTGTGAGKVGMYNYTIPIDYMSNMYTYLASGDGNITEAPAGDTVKLEPYYRLKELFDWFRVTGIKLEWFPGYDTEAGTDATKQQVQQMYPMNIGLDLEDANADSDLQAGYIIKSTVLGSANVNYDRALIQRMAHKKMNSDQRWQLYFKIRPWKKLITTSSKGGHAGTWQCTDSEDSPNATFGQIYIEQPYANAAALDNTVIGYLHVTKYLIMKGIKAQSGIPLDNDADTNMDG